MAGVFGALARSATDIMRSADEAVRLAPEAAPAARQAVKEVRPITTSPIRPVAAKPVQAGSTPKGIDISNTSGLDEEMNAMLGGAPAPSGSGVEMSDDLNEMFRLAEETLALPDAVPESDLGKLFSDMMPEEMTGNDRAKLKAGEIFETPNATVGPAGDLALQLLDSYDYEDGRLIASFYLGDTIPTNSSSKYDKFNMIRSAAESNIRASKWLKENYMKDMDFDSKFKFSDGSPLIFWRAIRTRGNMEDSPIKAGYDVFSLKIEEPDELGSHAGSFDQAFSFYGPEAVTNTPAFERAKAGLESLRADASTLRVIAKNGALDKEAAEGAATVIDKVADIVSDVLSPLAQLKEAVKAENNGIGLSMDRDTANLILEEVDNLRSNLLMAAPDDRAKEVVSSIIRKQKSALVSIFRQVSDSAADSYQDAATRPATTSIMAPMILRAKRPFEMNDLGTNDARNWVSWADDSRQDLNAEEAKLLQMMLSKPYYKKDDFGYTFTGNLDTLTKHDKDFQNALKELGYDSIVYTNTAEGIGAKKSIIVFDKEQVVTLEQIVPELKAMSKKEQRMVYNMMATGVGLQQAISIVMDDGGDA